MVDRFCWNFQYFVRCMDIFPRNLWDFGGSSEICPLDGSKLPRNLWDFDGWSTHFLGIFKTLFDGYFS